MITWSRVQSVKRLNGWWSFIINPFLSKFGSHSLRGSGDISFFICHVTSCGHVIAGSRNFAGCGPSGELTSLPNMETISFVEVEIWYILIFNVRRRIPMTILWQSVTMQFRRLFWHILYYKVRQSNFIIKRDRLLLQSASGITKCDKLYYKARQVLQSVTVITKWHVTSFITEKLFHRKNNITWQETLKRSPRNWRWSLILLQKVSEYRL